MEEQMQPADLRWTSRYRDYALTAAIYATVLFCAVGAIDYAAGWKSRFLMHVGFVGVFGFAALVLGYIVRTAMAALVDAATRRSS